MTIATSQQRRPRRHNMNKSVKEKKKKETVIRSTEQAKRDGQALMFVGTTDGQVFSFHALFVALSLLSVSYAWH